MIWTVDRIESDIAVIECNGNMLKIPCSYLPEGISEGSVITVLVEQDETERRRKKAKTYMESLFAED